MTSAARPVAMLDSGLGGLTVVSALRALLPGTDIVYYADTANVPYGDRPLAEVAALGARIIERLATHDPALIVIASGTTCAAFDAYGWPDAAVPLIGVIDAGARAAVRASAGGRIGVIATQGTSDSGVFERAIRAIAPAASVTSAGAPALVPIVEAGESHSARAAAAVAAASRPFIAANCDALILGCTHFPHLRRWFAQTLGPGVALIDPADQCAAEVVARLDRSAPHTARFVCEVSGDADEFAAHAAALGAPDIDALVHVPLPLASSR